jgi:glycosyltransferase involved in cell wall biosynthesis
VIRITPVLSEAETAESENRHSDKDSCNATTDGKKEHHKNSSRAAANSDKDIKIFYCGYMTSPFAVQDKGFLESAYTVSVFNLSESAATFSQVPGYLLKCFTKILPGVWKNDIVWVWGADYPSIPLMVFAKLFGKKIVFNLFGVEVYPPNELGYGFRMQKMRGAVSKWLMYNADMNIPMSDAYWDYLIRYIPLAPAWVMPGCVDATLYKPNYCTKEDLAVTAYCDYKLSLLIKGIPTFEAAMMQSRIRMEVIHNRSHQTQIEAFLRAKVYCQLSFTEQFGMSLLEAMACGCVPVVANRDGLPELVGNAGIVIPYGDPAALVKAIRIAIRMDGAVARARAEEFSVERKKMHMHNIITVIMNRDKSVGELLEMME